MAASTTVSVQMTLDPEIAALLPRPGEWTEDDYLWLIRSTNRLVELVDGHIEVLPMPTDIHQTILLYLASAFLLEMKRIGGKVLSSPMKMRIGPRKFREPDILLLLSADDPRRSNKYWSGADLVVEIVSPDDPNRDYVVKRGEYALANVPEYWIVDPRTWIITVLRLEGAAYVEHGVFGRGTVATSVILEEFSVDVDEMFEAD